MKTALIAMALASAVTAQTEGRWVLGEERDAAIHVPNTVDAMAPGPCLPDLTQRFDFHWVQPGQPGHNLPVQFGASTSHYSEVFIDWTPFPVGPVYVRGGPGAFGRGWWLAAPVFLTGNYSPNIQADYWVGICDSSVIPFGTSLLFQAVCWMRDSTQYYLVESDAVYMTFLPN